MKYILAIGDGMADAPIDALDGRTPLEALSLPTMARLAGQRLGRVRTVPVGVKPGSDTAILSIFGNDPRTCYTGRAALEAAGSGVDLQSGEVAFRVNLTAIEGDDLDTAVMRSHNGGNIEGNEAMALMQALLADPDFARIARQAGFVIYPTRTFRHIGVLSAATGGIFELSEPHNILGEGIAKHLPRGAFAQTLTALMHASHVCLRNHPINEARSRAGKLCANCIWPWAAGDAMLLPSFASRYGHSGPVVSAVPLLWGIARMSGLPAPHVSGATGDLDTNYAGK
ncbi:MAG: phosphoglycerate mutase, partial [Clostridia bacterium]